jgi:hypothetical protein
MTCACQCHSHRLVHRVPWSEVRAAGLTLVTLVATLLDKLM